MAGAPLTRVSSPDALLASPPPVCLPGARWATFRLARDVFAFTVWSRPSMEDVQALTRALELELSPSAPLAGGHPPAGGRGRGRLRGAARLRDEAVYSGAPMQHPPLPTSSATEGQAAPITSATAVPFPGSQP